MQSDSEIPSGFRLRHILSGHTDIIQQIAWAPSGRKIASASDDSTIRVWDGRIEKSPLILNHTDKVTCVAWSPDGNLIASAGLDKSIRLWNITTGRSILTFPRYFDTVWRLTWSVDGETIAAGTDVGILLYSIKTGGLIGRIADELGSATNLAWSPDGKTVAATSLLNGIRLYEMASGRPYKQLVGHADHITTLDWSRDGQVLAAGSDNHTVQLWNMTTGWQTGVLEGHTSAIAAVQFSYDDQFVAALSVTRALRVWHCETMEIVAIHERDDEIRWLSGSAFHPKQLTLATLGEKDTTIQVWDLDRTVLLRSAQQGTGVHYSNAKVVLLGDTGVGKSGLALTLSRQPFAATESTHARHVFLFDRRSVKLDSSRTAVRETLLWDMAGQPGYRLVHQLHLNEVAVAVVVFDARSETDPFAGVRHWDRALRQAQRIQGDAAPPLAKLLVAARMDRGGVGVSRERIDTLCKELAFDGYFETSAREGIGITKLTDNIHQAIVWKAQPQVSSTDLFQKIKGFLVDEKRKGRILSTMDDLYRAFVATGKPPAEITNLPAQFETCIGRVESRGLIRRLSFGRLILLQPELLDAYASALINAAKEEPDGLGSIVEEDARAGRFPLSADERIPDKSQESLLLISTVEDLLSHEIALREQASDGPHLVFPSQMTRENPDFPDPKGKTVVMEFEGPILNIYATLAVRLAYSGVFSKQDMWKNAATYSANMGGTCGLVMREFGEGRGTLDLFFDEAASQETRVQFEEFVYTHLLRRSLVDRVNRRYVVSCKECGSLMTDQIIHIRIERGYNWLNCPGCGQRISLHIAPEKPVPSERRVVIAEMDQTADAQRQRERAASIVQGKVATRDFDIFLAHNSKDKPQVEPLGEELRRRGLNPWIDKEQVLPGRWFQDVIQKAIPKVRSVAVCIGPHGVGRWQALELRTFLSECVDRNIPVIPVILPSVEGVPNELMFLKELTWVRFKTSVHEADALDELEWGITGTHPQRGR